MKAIFIDAKNRTTSIINNAGDLSAMYLALEVDAVEIGYYNQKTGDTLWIDENGRINGTTYGFKLFDREFYGHGVIYGSDLAGENTTPKMKLEDVKPEFLELEANPQIEIQILFGSRDY